MATGNEEQLSTPLTGANTIDISDKSGKKPKLTVSFYNILGFDPRDEYRKHKSDQIHKIKSPLHDCVEYIKEPLEISSINVYKTAYKQANDDLKTLSKEVVKYTETDNVSALDVKEIQEIQEQLSVKAKSMFHHGMKYWCTKYLETDSGQSAGNVGRHLIAALETYEQVFNRLELLKEKIETAHEAAKEVPDDEPANSDEEFERDLQDLKDTQMNLQKLDKLIVESTRIETAPRVQFNPLLTKTNITNMPNEQISDRNLQSQVKHMEAKLDTIVRHMNHLTMVNQQNPFESSMRLSYSRPNVEDSDKWYRSALGDPTPNSIEYVSTLPPPFNVTPDKPESEFKPDRAIATTPKLRGPGDLTAWKSAFLFNVHRYKICIVMKINCIRNTVNMNDPYISNLLNLTQYDYVGYRTILTELNKSFGGSRDDIAILYDKILEHPSLIKSDFKSLRNFKNILQAYIDAIYRSNRQLELQNEDIIFLSVTRKLEQVSVNKYFDWLMLTGRAKNTLTISQWLTQRVDELTSIYLAQGKSEKLVQNTQKPNKPVNRVYLTNFDESDKHIEVFEDDFQHDSDCDDAFI